MDDLVKDAITIALIFLVFSGMYHWICWIAEHVRII
jgi:hypothetical protein